MGPGVFTTQGEGGIGPGVFGFVLAGICVVAAVRFERRFRTSARDRPGAHASEEIVERFRRLWLISLAAILLGVAIAFVSVGTRAGTVALACGILFVASGAVALAVMRNRDGRL